MKIPTILGVATLAALVVSCTSTTHPSYTTYRTRPARETTVDIHPAPTPGTHTSVSVSPPATAEAYAEENETQTQSPSDQEVVTSVRHQFYRYGALSGDLPNITIVAEEGTVTLRGTVADQRDKEMIAAMVRNTPGVVNVIDQMSLAGNPPGVIEPTSRYGEGNRQYSEAFDLHVPGRNASDRELGERVLQELRPGAQAGPGAPEVDIYVANGRVQLHGQVTDEQQREEIVAAAQRAAGADNVEDDLQVQERAP